MDLSRLLSAPHVTPLQKLSLSSRFRFHYSRLGLEFKLLVIVVAVTLIGVLTSSAMILSLQRQQLIDTTQAAITRLSNAVEASLEHAMLDNDRVMLGRMVQIMANLEGSAERVRILDAQGVVRVSSTSAEIEKSFDRSDAACQFCHYDQSNSNNDTTDTSAHAKC